MSAVAKREANGSAAAVAMAPADDPILSDEKLWQVVSSGDLKGLSPKQKSDYYLYRCRQEGLNPASQPFQYMTLQGKEILYAGKTAADQLRKLHGISITAVECRDDGDSIECDVRVRDREGREDFETGVVFVGTAKGVERANAKMKCLTKAKRRATYSICGTGALDETEVETIPVARPEPTLASVTGEMVDTDTGEIVTSEALTANIKALREKLGWSANDVIVEAKAHGIDLRSLDGLQAMAARLAAFVAQEPPTADEDGALPLEAAYAVAGEAGNDKYTDG